MNSSTMGRGCPLHPVRDPEASGPRPTLGTKYRSTGRGLPGTPHLNSYEAP